MDLGTLPAAFDIDAFFKGMDPLLLPNNNNAAFNSSPEDDSTESSPGESRPSPPASFLGNKRKTDAESNSTAKDRRSLSGQLSHHHPDLASDDQKSSSNLSAKGRAARTSLSTNAAAAAAAAAAASAAGSTTDRRKEQNRNAQRAFRERKEKHIKELQERVDELLEQNSNKDSENELLRQLVSTLQQENERLKTSSAPSDPSSIPPSTTNIASDFPFSFSMPNDSPTATNTNDKNTSSASIPPVPTSSHSLSSASSTAPSSTSPFVFSPSNFLNDFDSPNSILSSHKDNSPNASSSRSSVNQDNSKQNSLSSFTSPNATEDKATSPLASTTSTSAAFPAWSGNAFTDYRNDSNFSIFGDVSNLFNTDYDNSMIINNNSNNNNLLSDSPTSTMENSTPNSTSNNIPTDPNRAFDELAYTTTDKSLYNSRNNSNHDLRHQTSTMTDGEKYSFDLDSLCSDMKKKAVCKDWVAKQLKLGLDPNASLNPNGMKKHTTTTCKEHAQQLLQQSLEEDEKRLAEAFPLHS